MDKNEEKMGNVDYRIPRGARVTLRQVTDGSWSWSVRVFKKLLAEGHDATRDGAEKALKKAMGPKLLAAGKTSQERATIKAKLKDWCQKRPYLAAFFFESVKAGMDLTVIREEAEQGERARWEADEGQKWRQPLPDHPLTKRPEKVVDILSECCEALGWQPQHAEHFARDFFGPWYFNPDADWKSAIEVIPLKKKRRDAEDEE